MHKRYPTLTLVTSCIILAILGHGLFLYLWTQDQYMTGINDGLSQMMPFKHLLYEQYTNGEFFYSFDFGLGAGTFSELSYYFSTSIVFLVTVLFVFLFEAAGFIQSTDVLFWANAAVFISVIRMSAVLFITARLFMYMKISPVSAFLGAAFYGVSGMYFRHVTYWEFFADAYLWLPLLILGIEKVFREMKPGWFLLAVTVSLLDNFYFSYVNFLLAGIYILFRLFIPLAPDEGDRKKALLIFLTAGLVGFGISAVSFIPAVYAYLNNHRPPFQQEIPIFDFSDNILFSSRFILLPAIFVLLVFAAYLYRNKTFRLFALLGLTTVIMHHSPLVGSIFNGFSAPQYRWEYFIALVMGGAIAAAIGQVHKFPLRNFAVAAGISMAVYALYAFFDKNFSLSSPVAYYTIGSLLMTFLLVFLIIRRHSPFTYFLLYSFLICWIVASANIYQNERLFEDGNISQVNKELITGSDYDDPEIRGLLSQIHQQEENEIYRIQWMEGVRNNTTIVQDFRGLSAYSSILNENLLFFYLYDLEIDMGRESVSRYATLGNRANLHSLLQGNYVIRPKDDSNIPYGFAEFAASENYTVYKNTNTLSFVRSASTIFKEEDLVPYPPLVREHAMLTGIVLDGAEEGAAVPETGDITEQFNIEEIESSFSDGVLEVYGESGGIDLVRQNPETGNGDLYTSFHLENQAFDEGFNLMVNDYKTSRKSNQSVYKTFVDDLTIRVPADERIRIRVPEGKYKLTEIEVYEEDYSILETQAGKDSGMERLDIDGSRVEVEYTNDSGADYLTAGIPFERGWSATVNGEKTEVLKANYAFVGVPIEDGENKVVFTYRPPFFKASLIISVISLITGLVWIFNKRKKK